ncbi:cytochrome c-551 [Lentibacillus kapialis]|uniref:Cytochrome c-551 n=1 Tax=Lentibacillus kapialis TaxID=340214 RepID=A0A917V005_9BACI|nr:cytochrome c [Lentibacillus kapialis]GGK03080.1 cytochrome c-551 [Lentibacillus kapialis]
MKKWLWTMLFGTALVLGACGGGGDNGGDGGDSSGSDGGDTSEAGAAEELFQNNCASCHGQDLSGGAGPDLTSVGADHSADDIVNIIKNGKGQMPAQSQVSDEDAQTIASWLAEKK